MPEAENKLLQVIREHYISLYAARIGEALGWCDDMQNHTLPFTWNGSGKGTYVSRGVGGKALDDLGVL